MKNIVTIQQEVVVCIVAYRNIDDVLNCLSGLEQQSFANFAVVICENGGPEAYATLSARVPGKLAGGQPVSLLADQSNPGYAGGINRCIEALPGRNFYWILNPDTVAQPGTLTNMLRHLNERGLDAVGGPIVLPDGRLQTCGGRWNQWVAGAVAIGMGRPSGAHPTTAEVEADLDFISGASLLVSRRYIQVAGLMREDYFLYGEEIEWCLRGKQRGLKLGFCPSADVLHFHGTTTGSGQALADQGRLPIYCNERNRILVQRDTGGALRFAIGVVGAAALIGWRYGRRGAWRAMRVAIAGWWAGIRNVRGKPAWIL